MTKEKQYYSTLYQPVVMLQFQFEMFYPGVPLFVNFQITFFEKAGVAVGAEISFFAKSVNFFMFFEIG